MEGENKIKKIRLIILLFIFFMGLSSVEIQAKAQTSDMKILPMQEQIKLKSLEGMPNVGKYVSVEQAAKKVRQKVINHRSNISVFFKSKASSPTKAYEEFKKELTKDVKDISGGDYLYWDISSQTMQYSYFPINEKGKEYYCYQFNIRYRYYTTLAQKKKVVSKVKSIIRSFKFNKKTSNYKKIKKIYDYVCKNVKYAYKNLSFVPDDSNLSFTSYSALFYGKAVCQGYSQLMYIMLKEADVPVRLIPGYSKGETHGWNIVRIGKYYYNIDATWDSTYYHMKTGYKYFLKGDNFKDHVRFAEYKTDDFYSRYPMARYAYRKGKNALSTKSKRAKFKVKIPKIKNTNGGEVTLDKVESGVKYIIQYSKNSAFSNAKKMTVKKTKVNLSDVDTNSEYYVRFRASKKIGGKTVYTKWSGKKTVTV